MTSDDYRHGSQNKQTNIMRTDDCHHGSQTLQKENIMTTDDSRHDSQTLQQENIMTTDTVVMAHAHSKGPLRKFQFLLWGKNAF